MTSATVGHERHIYAMRAFIYDVLREPTPAAAAAGQYVAQVQIPEPYPRPSVPTAIVQMEKRSQRSLCPFKSPNTKIPKTGSPGAGPVYQQTVGDEFLANSKPKPAISSTNGMEGTPPFMPMNFFIFTLTGMFLLIHILMTRVAFANAIVYIYIYIYIYRERDVKCFELWHFLF